MFLARIGTESLIDLNQSSVVIQELHVFAGKITFDESILILPCR